MQKNSGFTLIELMIVVAIIAILAALALPSYNAQITKTRRTDAMAALTSFANAMERHATDNGSYLGAGTVAGNTGAPTIFATQVPLDGDAKYYNLTIDAATATSFTLKATPIGVQVGDGFIELLSTNQRRWDKDNDGTIQTTENQWTD
ncbi:MAG: prepilin-type N-terminal cleavage/methylation domain-containing protein [Pseudomonadales bacterium]|nr:prepilin-type N-terminal cleavage/methylation domain-containing protein [Pseudomonadales bacterium]